MSLIPAAGRQGRMKFSEEQVREIVAMRENLTEQMDMHQRGMEMLEKNIATLDLFLKDSSFTKASQMRSGDGEPAAVPPEEEPADDGTIPIKRSGDGRLLGSASVTPDRVSIVLKGDVAVGTDTPPFKSFFMDRIIGQMERKDGAEVEGGRMGVESAIKCTIDKDGSGNIRGITVQNYRHRERADEIISTATWVLSRMAENAGK